MSHTCHIVSHRILLDNGPSTDSPCICSIISVRWCDGCQSVQACSTPNNKLTDKCMRQNKKQSMCPACVGTCSAYHAHNEYSTSQKAPSAPEVVSFNWRSFYTGATPTTMHSHCLLVHDNGEQVFKDSCQARIHAAALKQFYGAAVSHNL